MHCFIRGSVRPARCAFLLLDVLFLLLDELKSSSVGTIVCNRKVAQRLEQWRTMEITGVHIAILLGCVVGDVMTNFIL